MRNDKRNLYMDAHAEKRSAKVMKDPERTEYNDAVTQAMEKLETLNAMRIAHLANYALKEEGRPYFYRMKEEGGEAWVYAREEVGLHSWMDPFIDVKNGGYKRGVATALENVLNDKPYEQLQAKITQNGGKNNLSSDGKLFTTASYGGYLEPKAQRKLSAPVDWAKQENTDALQAGKVVDTVTQTQRKVALFKTAPTPEECIVDNGNDKVPQM